MSIGQFPKARRERIDRLADRGVMFLSQSASQGRARRSRYGQVQQFGLLRISVAASLTPALR